MRRIFLAATVEAAVVAAKQELGDDALLVEVLPGTEYNGSHRGYRVVFEAASRLAETVQPTVKSAEGEVQMETDYAQVKSELVKLSSLVACLASSAGEVRRWPELTRIAASLQACDLPADFAHSLLNRVEMRLGMTFSASVLRRVLADEMHALVECDTGVDPESRRTVVALVGPPGAGKTSMLVKLAMRLGVSARRPALILSTDGNRVGGADQLRAYAGVLGLPFRGILSPHGLSAALAEHREKELVLIDTPGFGRRDWDLAREWAEALEVTPEIQVQLVLPATTRASDLRDLVRRWAMFRPSHLIFTHMDETATYGGCVAASLEANKPLSWFGTGQNIPEDAESASAERLFGSILGYDLNTMAAGA